MLKNIIHIFILSCEKVSLLTEKQLHTKLGVVDRIQLRVHLSICKLCVCNKEKTTIIHKIIENRVKNIENQSSKFDKAEIDNMKSAIKKHTCDSHE